MKLKIGIVTSRFNAEYTELLKKGAVNYLQNLKTHSVQIIEVDVPGAVEIPLACAWLLDHGCDGVVTCGAVIRGETTHYEMVCNSVERGVTELMLKYQRPIGFGVITTENDQQAQERCGGAHGNKGQEAAAVCIEMLEHQQRILGL